MKIRIFNYLLVFSILIPMLVYSQSYEPTYQSNSNLDFKEYLSGVRFACVLFNEDVQNKIDQGNLEYYTSSIVKYLEFIGFEYIAIKTNEKEELKKLKSYCDIVDIYFGYTVPDSKEIKDIVLGFFTCLGDKFIFESNKRIKNNDDWLNNLYDVWTELFGFKKPNFTKNNSLSMSSKMTIWTFQSLKDQYQQNITEQIEGIYEKIRFSSSELIDAKYLIGIIYTTENDYDIIYLGGANNYDDWKEGELKGKIYKTATTNFYRVDWLMANKSVNEDVYAFIDEANLLNITFTGSKDDNQTSKFLKLLPIKDSNRKNSPKKGSGTTFVIDQSGYVVTSHHVIENSNEYNLLVDNKNTLVSYKLRLVVADKNNDLAILKVDDDNFKGFSNPPFSIKSIAAEVGEEVFVLGYPLLTSMGNELKVTNGIISSKSGFQGDITTYQISAPVQPGNSGGPLFDKKGNLIGIVSAKHTGAENVSYAIKSSYLKNIIESLIINQKSPDKNNLIGKSLSDQIKILKDFVYIIEVN